tara:strand:+ start:45 stop:266 length:222 start_codon:yes stop_codon:yes gene_type:complete
MNKVKFTPVFLMLTGCPVAKAYEVTKKPECIIDQCDEKFCTIETPEGMVTVSKKPDYEEGMAVSCPFHLIEPT